MAGGELQDCSLTARGWEVMSSFVFFLYASKDALKISKKISSKLVEGAEVGICDIWLVKGGWSGVVGIE
jgi:hypothetical protein